LGMEKRALAPVNSPGAPACGVPGSGRRCPRSNSAGCPPSRGTTIAQENPVRVAIALASFTMSVWGAPSRATARTCSTSALGGQCGSSVGRRGCSQPSRDSSRPRSKGERRPPACRTWRGHRAAADILCRQGAVNSRVHRRAVGGGHLLKSDPDAVRQPPADEYGRLLRLRERGPHGRRRCHGHPPLRRSGGWAAGRAAGGEGLLRFPQRPGERVQREGNVCHGC
jgi:hypothetical protein